MLRSNFADANASCVEKDRRGAFPGKVRKLRESITAEVPGDLERENHLSSEESDSFRVFLGLFRKFERHSPPTSRDGIINPAFRA
jgi:hypothetical protein